eukprot:3941908-Rhodomonas_salina.3
MPQPTRMYEATTSSSLTTAPPPKIPNSAARRSNAPSDPIVSFSIHFNRFARLSSLSPCFSKYLAGVTRLSSATQYGNDVSSFTLASRIASSLSSLVSRSLLQSRFPMIRCTRSGYLAFRSSSSRTKRMSPIPLSCESPPNTNSLDSSLNSRCAFVASNCPPFHPSTSDISTYRTK